MSLTVVGAELRMDYDVPLRYGQDSLVALAGPGANLLFGLLALGLDWELAAVVSLTIGAFNLLPIPPLMGEGWCMACWQSGWIQTGLSG